MGVPSAEVTLPLDEEHVSLLRAFVLLVDLHRLLAPGRVLPVEWSFHVAGRNVRLAFVGDGVHQYRGLRDVREQDELVLLADLGEKAEHRHPLLFGHPVLLDHLVYRPDGIGQDPRQPLAISPSSPHQPPLLILLSRITATRHYGDQSGV